MSSALDPMPPWLPSLWRSLRLGYRASPGLILVAFVTTVAAAVPDALLALGLASLLQAVVDGDGRRVALTVLVVGVLAAGSWLFTVVSERANLRFADRAAIAVESHVARLQSSVATLEHQERPEALDRLAVLRTHVAALSGLYQQLFATIGALLRLVITLVLLVSVHPLLGLLGLLALPTVLVSNWRGGVEKAVEEGAVQHDRLARHLFTLATTPAPAKELRVARVQSRLRQLRRTAWHHRYRQMSRARTLTALWQSAAQVLFGVAFVLAVLFVAGRGPTAAGDVLLVLTAGSRLSQYIGETVGKMQFFRMIWLDVARRLAWLEDFARRQEAEAPEPAPDRLSEGIRFEGVTFRYPGTDRLVLDDVDLHLPPGAVVAVVGENGAGKTTLVKLLARMYDPDSGRITVDGTDLKLISAPAWRKRISGAFQDFFQFEYPLQHAVGLGDLPRVDDQEAVRAAVERGGATDVVTRLPDGLRTQLGANWEGGVGLSHGQWQKVALARGFMQDDPLLLVLDEPTSALDAEVEHLLFERYAEAARAATATGSGRITVLVSHRFSTVRMADVIVVLDGARVVEHGSHDQLMAQDGQYAALYRIQAAGYRADATP
ncbi:ABC transporter ATP-binding protein [Micromonospora sp. NPDC050187]|uniref:ABC transporter ATP-binding protein n=1 Tax=Micromonospora sp. NPDC050187 TaxID=3364277 RepID=UPI0037BC4FC4